MKKVVLITGASSGIGKVTAELLAVSGYIVYGAARRVEKMKDLETLGVKTLKMNVTDDASMVSGVEQIIAEQGVVDILINNAGFGFYGTVEDVPIEDAKYQLDVNLFGAARLTQLVLPKMREKGWGKIINISSIAGKFAMPFGGWYHASKFALEGLSDSLRNEVRDFGIDVILIEPGGIKSEWADISTENLMKNAGNPAYNSMRDKLVRFMRKLNKAGERPNASPMIIAKLIKKSIEAKNPKTRYSGGYMARFSLFGKKWLPDKIFDKVLLMQMR